MSNNTNSVFNEVAINHVRIFGDVDVACITNSRKTDKTIEMFFRGEYVCYVWKQGNSPIAFSRKCISLFETPNDVALQFAIINALASCDDVEIASACQEALVLIDESGGWEEYY